MNTIVEDIRDWLKGEVDTHDFIDVGKGAELLGGVSQLKFRSAVQLLVDEGYSLINVLVDQNDSTAKRTVVKVLAKPDTTYQEVYTNRDKIHPVTERV